MKNQRQFTVPFGKGSIEFELPSEMSGIEVVSRHVPPVSDVPEAIVAALDNPVNSPPLRDIARQGDKVCIVFTDITRANPDQLLVP
ncbi:MAG: lactate racemase domain-containing protein, partial [Chloroflexota bacterium]